MIDPSLGPNSPELQERGALISDHAHPNALIRRLTAIAAAAGLIGAAGAVVGLLALAVIHGLPLLALMAVFLVAMCAPLPLLIVLHPRVTVYEHGLWLRPALGRGVWVPWSAVRGLADHTLIRRGTTRRGQRELTGQLVIVDGLPRVFLVVGMMAGLGRRRAFGIASHSHRDYPALLNAIKKHEPRS